MPKKEFKDFIDDIQTAINIQLIKDEDLKRISTSYSLFLIESDLVFFEKNMRRSLTKMRPFSLTAHFTETPIYRRFRHQIMALAFRGFEPHRSPQFICKTSPIGDVLFFLFNNLLSIDLTGPCIPKERSHPTEILKRFRLPLFSDIGQRMRAALRSVQT